MTRSRIPLLLALALLAAGAAAQNPPLLRAPLQAPAGSPGSPFELGSRLEVASCIPLFHGARLSDRRWTRSRRESTRV